MRFTISKSDLHTALSITGRCIGSANIIPVLGTYRLKVADNELIVSTTDQERFISYKTEVKSDGECDILLPFARLRDYINDLPEQGLTITVTDKQIEIESLSGKCKIAHEAGDDFPTIQHDNVQIVAGVESKELLDVIEKVSFACATDKEPRIYFQGVLFELLKDKLQLTATDAMVFSTAATIFNSGKVGEFILFKKSVETLLNLPVNDLITISIAGNSVQFTLNEQTVYTCILCAERYPKYRGILPDAPIANMTILRTELLSSLKRVSRFSYDVVTLDCGSVLKVQATNVDLNEEAAEEISTDYTGDPMTFMVLGSRLISCLAKMNSESVTLQLTDSKRGVLIKQNIELGNGECMLVMPVIENVL